MPSKLVEVAQVRADSLPILNAYLGDDWRLIGITDGNYHVGRFEEGEDEDDGRFLILEWLNNLDPEEVDRKALEGLGMGDRGGAASYIRTFKQMLGFKLMPEPVPNDDE